MKRCYRCHQDKATSEYYKCAQRKDGYSNECKQCSSERTQETYTEEKRADTYARAQQWKQSNPKGLWVHWAVHRAKRRAKVKDLPFDLTSKDLMPLVPDACPVFGTPFMFTGNASGGIDTSPSIDRIDPKKGYVLENIAIISVKANSIKNAYSAAELMQVALWLNEIEHDKT